MITATYCSHTASAQTSTPTSTPSHGYWTTLGPNYRVPLPKEGLIPDRETAIKIAEVVLFRLYGDRDIINQRPYQVKEEDDIWFISGTLKEGDLGSVFAVAISKQTGAILHLEH
jgi:hypothetical protein